MTITSGNASTATQINADPFSGEPATVMSEQQTGVATLAGTSASGLENLTETVRALQSALEAATAARELAERRLRLQRDQVDDDLAAALAACRDLEDEKMAALHLQPDGDAGLFEAEASHPADVLTLASLQKNYEARIEALTAEWSTRLTEQKLELSKQYFAEVQDLATASARAGESQARHWQARDVERESVIAALKQEIAVLNQDIAASATSLASVRNEVAARVSNETELRDQIGALTADLHVIRSELAAAQTRIHLLLSSTSWRASRPIRGGGRVLRWMRGR